MFFDFLSSAHDTENIHLPINVLKFVHKKVFHVRLLDLLGKLLKFVLNGWLKISIWAEEINIFYVL